MSDRYESFEVGERPRLSVRLGSGSVRIVGGEAGRVEVIARGRQADSLVIEQAGDLVSVAQEQGSFRRGSTQVTFTTPPGTGVVASLASADLDVEVPVQDLTVSAASGDLRAVEVRRELVVKTASGDVEVDLLLGKGKLNAASGDIRIRTARGDSTVNTASGDIEIGEASGDVGLRSVSGDVVVSRYTGSDIVTSTVSGDVVIRVPRGRSVDVNLRSLSGRIQLPTSPGGGGDNGKPHVRVRFKSVSGDFELSTSDS